jgi:septin family protein
MEDRLFIYDMRDYMNFSKEEINIIGVYSELYSDGNNFNRICDELILAINNYHSYFEEEIRNKNIDDKRFHNLLFNILNKLFHFCEQAIREIYFLEKFMNIIVIKFEKYYTSEKEKYNPLKKCVKFETVQNNYFLDIYINKEVLDAYYHIVEQNER